MSYSVFRVQGIKITSDLAGIGKHNKERISNTNPDINSSKSKENITLIACDETFNQKFNDITKEMRTEHEERMKNMRADRVKSFDKYINEAKNDVAFEMLFTSDTDFFENMNRNDIIKWAENSLEFVKKDIGIKQKDILHAVIHMDEKTPHLHVVAVPLIKAYDGRRKTEMLQINRSKYIHNGKHLSKLQDLYNKHMNESGFNLERGVKDSNKKHTETIEYKQELLKELKNEIRKDKIYLKRYKETIKNITLSELDVRGIKGKKSLIGDNITVKNEEFTKLKELAGTGAYAVEEVNRLNNILEKKKKKVEDLEKKLEEYENKISFYSKNNKELSKKMQETQIAFKVLKNVVYENNLIDIANKRFDEELKELEKKKLKEKINAAKSINEKSKIIKQLRALEGNNKEKGSRSNKSIEHER